MRPVKFLLVCAALLGGISAAAAPYAACEKTKKISGRASREEIRQFVSALNEQFELHFTVSGEEIQKNVDCLQGKLQGEECEKRLVYFERTLPLQLKKYRTNRALSAWSSAMLHLRLEGEPVFNYKLAKPHMFWMEQATPNALSAAEAVDVQARFEKESRRILQSVINEIKNLPAHTPFSEKGHAERSLPILESGDWGKISDLRNQTKWTREATGRMEQLVFRVNKKRLVQQLMLHPILAFIADEKISRENILTALASMQDNLNKEQKKISGVLWKMLHRPQWSEVELDPILDYVTVAESLLMQHPELCQTGVYLFDSYESREFWKAVVVGSVTLGAMILAPPVMALAGGIAVQGYMFYRANEDRRDLMQSAFTNPQTSLQLRSVDEAYLKADGVVTEVLLAPLAVTGIPLFRMSKILRILN